MYTNVIITKIDFSHISGHVQPIITDCSHPDNSYYSFRIPPIWIDSKFAEVNYRVAWNIVWRTPYRDDIYVPTDDYIENDWQFIIGHVPVQRVAGLDTNFEAFHDQNILLIDGGCSYRNDGILEDNEYGVICIKLDDMSETVLTFASL